MASSITKLVIEGISSHSMLLDSYVVLHAALISSLHKVIGVEFGMKHWSLLLLPLIANTGAYFIQNVVEDYERHYQELQSDETYPPVDHELETQDQDSRGKECSNLMVLLSELYNFQVLSSVLIFDLVRELLQGDLTEFNIELLLKLMRSKYYLTYSNHPSLSS